MTHKEQAYEQISRRAELFGKHINSYKAAERQNETETRVKFIDHFFKSLGWDMDNSKCLPPHLEEVIREETISIEGTETKKNELFARHSQGRTDYTFRDKFGKPLFYVEAKKPSVDILDGNDEALQIRSYSWNTNLPIGILTDFEEFAVYDGTIPTKPNDKAAVARADYFNYAQYSDRKTFDYIYDRFAQPNVTHGSLREYQKTYNDRFNYRKGTKTVDEAFLESLEQWRTELAQHIVLYNDQETFSLDEINYFVQITLNRILFLRNCEDRNIEPYKGLFICTEEVKEKDRIYTNFLQICERADRRYNSGLFDLTRYNRLVYRMRIGNGTLGNLIRNTYYPVSPYRFELISPDILGTAYERFLGKSIVITNKLNAKGQPLGNTVNGIFIPSKTATVDYKPEVRKAGGVFYTPQYVVKYIIENTIGKQIHGLSPNEVSALTFCDPACGSGSFLIGVYQYLIDWHTEYYTENPSAAKAQPNRPAPLQGGRLTVAERKRILTNNIYGVDIDAQAVEVTKLSLLMLCLADTASPDPSEGGEITHLLPNIDANIQCGNSLIDTEFDWKRQFKAVFAKGGFDAVVGNPPYGASLDEKQKAYLKAHYKTFSSRGESYVLFSEKATNLLKIGGYLGYIIPDTYLNLDFTKPMREFLLQQTTIKEIIALPSTVFKDATVDTSIFIIQKEKSTTTFYKNKVAITVFAKKINITDIKNDESRQFEIDTEDWYLSNTFNVQSDKAEINLIQNLDTKFKTVNDIAEMFYGIKAYQVGKGKPAQTELIRDTKPFTATTQKTKEWKPFYDGKHIGRYKLQWNDNNWIHYGTWLAEPRQPKKYEGKKILIRKIIGETLIATYVGETSYCNTLLFVLKLKDFVKLDYLYVLGILNSKFIGWYFRKKFQIAYDDTFPQIMIRDILQFAFPTEPDKKSEQKIIQLVEKILLQKTTNKPDTSALEAEIDALVYALYGLTAAEIAVVEGA